MFTWLTIPERGRGWGRGKSFQQYWDLFSQPQTTLFFFLKFLFFRTLQLIIGSHKSLCKMLRAKVTRREGSSEGMENCPMLARALKPEVFSGLLQAVWGSGSCDLGRAAMSYPHGTDRSSGDKRGDYMRKIMWQPVPPGQRPRGPAPGLWGLALAARVSGEMKNGKNQRTRRSLESVHRGWRERNSVPCKETEATWLEKACEWGPGVCLDSWLYGVPLGHRAEDGFIVSSGFGSHFSYLWVRQKHQSNLHIILEVALFPFPCHW